MKRTVAIMLGLACAVAACGGDDDAVSSSLPAATTLAVTTAPAEPAAPSGWSVAGSLSGIPRAEGQFQVTTADLRRVADLLQLEPPESPSDEAAVREWLLDLTMAGDRSEREVPVWVPMTEPLVPLDLSSFAAFDELLGWSVLDVDSFVHLQPEPPGYLLEVTGTFDDDALAGLATAADGVLTTHEAEDYAQDLQARSPVDRLGRAVRLARDGDRIAVALSVAAAEDWLAGADPSLADDEHLAAVAAALDDSGVLSAHLFRYDFRFSPGQLLGASPAQLEETLTSFPITEPFDTVGIGWTVDDSGSARTLVAYSATGSAGRLAEQLEAAYTDGLSLVEAAPVADVLGVEDLDVAVQGNVVTVSYAPVERFWESAARAVFQRDVPMVYVDGD